MNALEAASALGVSKWTIYRMIWSGKLKAQRRPGTGRGREYIIARSDLEKMGKVTLPQITAYGLVEPEGIMHIRHVQGA